MNSFRVWYSHPLLHRTQPKPCRFRAQSPEPSGRLSLRLDVYSPPQVLQIDGRICHLVLAFLVVGDFTNSRAPSLRGRYPASPLLRAHPSPSRLRSTSRLSRLYDRPCSSDFRAGTRRASPVARHVLATVLSLPPRRSEGAASVRFRLPHAAFALRLRTRPSGLRTFEATFAFTVVTARWLVVFPRETLSIGLRVLVSRHPAIQTPGLLTLAPAGLSPAEHASLRWTHNQTGNSLS